jgi:hypothetical protein
MSIKFSTESFDYPKFREYKGPCIVIKKIEDLILRKPDFKLFIESNKKIAYDIVENFCNTHEILYKEVPIFPVLRLNRYASIISFEDKVDDPKADLEFCSYIEMPVILAYEFYTQVKKDKQVSFNNYELIQSLIHELLHSLLENISIVYFEKKNNKTEQLYVNGISQARNSSVNGEKYDMKTNLTEAIIDSFTIELTNIAIKKDNNVLPLDKLRLKNGFLNGYYKDEISRLSMLQTMLQLKGGSKTEFQKILISIMQTNNLGLLTNFIKNYTGYKFSRAELGNLELGNFMQSINKLPPTKS